jgi:hypothetical protein
MLINWFRLEPEPFARSLLIELSLRVSQPARSTSSSWARPRSFFRRLRLHPSSYRDNSIKFLRPQLPHPRALTAPFSSSPITSFQASAALRPRLALDSSKLLPFSFSSLLILTTAAAMPTETAKMGSRVLRNLVETGRVGFCFKECGCEDRRTWR